MPEQEQKPFLTVETGEAFQPIRLTYEILDKDKLIKALNSLKCFEKNSTHPDSWIWFWRNECDELQLESIDSFKKDPAKPIRIATITLHDDSMYMSLASFKRACLAIPFIYASIAPSIARLLCADFINKVFGFNEKLPRGYADTYKEEELEKISKQRIKDYRKAQEKIEKASNPEEAFAILADYNNTEAKKTLPYAERYDFSSIDIHQDPDITFLGFYIFLRTRELVAIRRWFGQTDYTVADAAEESVESIFGGMNIDIIE